MSHVFYSCLSLCIILSMSPLSVSFTSACFSLFVSFVFYVCISLPHLSFCFLTACLSLSLYFLVSTFCLYLSSPLSVVFFLHVSVNISLSISAIFSLSASISLLLSHLSFSLHDSLVFLFCKSLPSFFFFLTGCYLSLSVCHYLFLSLFSCFPCLFVC